MRLWSSFGARLSSMALSSGATGAHLVRAGEHTFLGQQVQCHWREAAFDVCVVLTLGCHAGGRPLPFPSRHLLVHVQC